MAKKSDIAKTTKAAELEARAAAMEKESFKKMKKEVGKVEKTMKKIAKKTPKQPVVEEPPVVLKMPAIVEGPTMASRIQDTMVTPVVHTEAGVQKVAAVATTVNAAVVDKTVPTAVGEVRQNFVRTAAGVIPTTSSVRSAAAGIPLTGTHHQVPRTSGQS